VVWIVRLVAKSFACSVAPEIGVPAGSMTMPLRAPSTAVWALAPEGCKVNKAQTIFRRIAPKPARFRQLCIHFSRAFRIGIFSVVSLKKFIGLLLGFLRKVAFRGGFLWTTCGELRGKRGN
jgi:hypothetical protein